MSFILDREPKLVWKHFDEIRKIPRCSKHEEGIRRYIVDFAEAKGLEHHVDKAGNVVVRKGGTPGMEHRPIVVLQGHLDMVCEKNSDKVHDFSKDPIELVQDGEWLTANGTTLGADNGIGVAIGLAILEDKAMEHGPVEALFTVDEETGLNGAFAMQEDFLKGRVMLNLDSEDMGDIFVGCAGGGDSVIRLPIRKKLMPITYSLLELKISGLKGGHSGLDINEQRGNALKVLGRVLYDAWELNKLYIQKIEGGNLRNAIPREAFVTVAVKGAIKDEVMERMQRTISEIKVELGPADPDLVLDLTEKKVRTPRKVLPSAHSKKVIHLLVSLPHGLIAMSHDMPDLVETSCNLAVIKLGKKNIMIQMSSRSSIMSALNATRNCIRSIATTAGAEVEMPLAYPGWKPNLRSGVLAIAQKVYRSVTGKEPKLKGIHAGLETGIIGERFPGMDMISIGPEIKNPHSPDERVHMGTVDDFYKIVAMILKDI